MQAHVNLPGCPVTRGLLRYLTGLQDYLITLQAMRSFTDKRGPSTPDEIWLLEHPPIFTLGQAGRWDAVHDPGSIPVIQVDRGGQITYHGPGQLVAYLLLDLQRANLGIKNLVYLLEQCVIDLLNYYGIQAHRRSGAPGVYVADAKIAALGLRIRNGCSYHGIALNVAMDLEPFRRIDPCGYAGLAITQITDWVAGVSVRDVSQAFIASIAKLSAGIFAQWQETFEQITNNK